MGLSIFIRYWCREVGIIKNAIKDAILDGRVANEHDAAFEFMLPIAASLGLTPLINQSASHATDTENAIS